MEIYKIPSERQFVIKMGFSQQDWTEMKKNGPSLHFLSEANDWYGISSDYVLSGKSNHFTHFNIDLLKPS